MPLYTQLFKELDVKLTHAIDTHVHADHVTALGTLRETLVPKQSTERLPLRLALIVCWKMVKTWRLASTV